jgi:hypothetical protein
MKRLPDWCTSLWLHSAQFCDNGQIVLHLHIHCLPTNFCRRNSQNCQATFGYVGNSCLSLAVSNKKGKMQSGQNGLHWNYITTFHGLHHHRSPPPPAPRQQKLQSFTVLHPAWIVIPTPAWNCINIIFAIFFFHFLRGFKMCSLGATIRSHLAYNCLQLFNIFVMNTFFDKSIRLLCQTTIILVLCGMMMSLLAPELTLLHECPRQQVLFDPLHISTAKTWYWPPSNEPTHSRAWSWARARVRALLEQWEQSLRDVSDMPWGRPWQQLPRNCCHTIL